MAKKKAGSSKAQQKSEHRGKRLGVKTGSGQQVNAGQILVRQRGTKIRAGKNVAVGRDHTLYAKKAGRVQFSNYSKRQKKVEIV